MFPVNFETTTLKSKRGTRYMRLIVVEGRPQMTPSGSIVPAVIVEAAGRTKLPAGCQIERLKRPYDGWRVDKAKLYQAHDVDWLMQDQRVEVAETDAQMRSIAGRPLIKLIGQDFYDEMTSVFPLSISKMVLRSLDGLETKRVLRIENGPKRAILLKSVKRALMPEMVEVHRFDRWGGAYDEFKNLKWKFRTGYELLEESDSVATYDEDAFQNLIGLHALNCMTVKDYAHLIPHGKKPADRASEAWQDGFDYGGNGLPRASPTAPMPSSDPPTAKAADTATPPGSVNVPSKRPSAAYDRRSEAREFEEDPNFGQF